MVWTYSLLIVAIEDYTDSFDKIWPDPIKKNEAACHCSNASDMSAKVSSKMDVVASFTRWSFVPLVHLILGCIFCEASCVDACVGHLYATLEMAIRMQNASEA